MNSAIFVDDDAVTSFSDESKEALLQARPYYIVNRHPTRTIQGYRLYTGAWSNWIRLPNPIGLTCNLGDINQCADQQRWGLLGHIETEIRYDIQIALLDTDGKWSSATAKGIVIGRDDLYGWSYYPA